MFGEQNYEDTVSYFLVCSIKYRKLKYAKSKNIGQTQSWEKLKKAL